jgi:hypothetical protein
MPFLALATAVARSAIRFAAGRDPKEKFDDRALPTPAGGPAFVCSHDA